MKNSVWQDCIIPIPMSYITELLGSPPKTSGESKKKLLKSLQGRVPDDQDAQKLVKRLQEYEAEYFRFIRTTIPPTNNPAEQTIRKVVLNRNVIRGTRSNGGNRWLERFRSIQTTCEQQGRNLLDYMTQTLVHDLCGTVPQSPIYS